MTVYLDKTVAAGVAKGWLYFDDGESFNYNRAEEYQIAMVQFDPVTGVLNGTKINMNTSAAYTTEFDMLV
jgi:hypothetical protein